jgi:hypothetical protein
MVKINITTSIPLELHTLATDNDIAWSEAIVFGIKFLVAEKKGVDYPENSLSKKVIKMVALLEDKSKITEVPNEDTINKEAEEVLSKII